jgi:hypothetical protein
MGRKTGRRLLSGPGYALVTWALLVPGMSLMAQPPDGGQAESGIRLVELEIVGDDRGQLGQQQEWMEMLTEVGADRVKASTSARPGGPAIEELRSGTTTVIRVRGVLAGRKLRMPGGEFSINDRDAIAALLRKLRDDGAEQTLAEKVGFGLTSEQLVALHGGLAASVEAVTKGEALGTVVSTIRTRLPAPLVMSPEVESLIAGDEAPVREELQGVSLGTALAILVRPHGLVVVPQRPQGGSLQIAVLPGEAVEEFWPIGWPVEEQVAATAPGLFEKTDVEIRGFKLADAMTAISGRTAIPVFYDHNSLAEKEVDPAEAIVTLARPQLTYFSIIIKLCSQTRPALAPELRMDEAGKPFLWVF